MQTRKFSSQLSVALTAIAMATLVTATCAAAQTEKVLYSFAYGSQPGAYPSSGLIFDAGNLYGATDFAGSNGSGAAFELTRQADGDWIGKSLYSFSPDNFGEFPVGLVFGASGHLYGVTLNGGTLNCAIGDEGLSCGTVFELTKMCGHWTGKILHDFDRNGKDGFFPEAGVIVDAAGNLYGTTGQGGAYGGGTYTGGTVFKLTPKSGGWTETILHNFGNDKDGQIPEGLTFDAAGNLYGITFEGGAYGLGTAFELTPNSGGWTETILHSFGSGKDGSFPPLAQPQELSITGSLILDDKGNLYGTTASGGDYGGGTVFELMPAVDGTWTETVLHSFNGIDGSGPLAGVIVDAKGNLYGTTTSGGDYGGGTAFKLMPAEDGTWTETVLHSFNDNGTDGWEPLAGLTFDASGNLYGTTYQGGTGNCYEGCGTAFEITP